MAIEIKQKNVDGFDKELLLVGEGYVARPVTLTKTSISGMTANEDGKYVIPQGSYLYGADGVSLLENPQQYAVVVGTTDVRATATIDSTLKVTSKLDGNVSDTVTLVGGTNRYATVDVVTGATNAITVNLGTNKSGSITTTYKEVEDLLNSDMVANTFLIVEPATSSTDVSVVASTAAVTLSGGSVGTVDGNIDGVLYHTVDVTEGEATGAMIINGFIDSDKMPVTPSAAIKAKLPHIVFGRKD